jgi:hypothetical protein
MVHVNSSPYPLLIPRILPGRAPVGWDIQKDTPISYELGVAQPPTLLQNSQNKRYGLDNICIMTHNLP